MLIGIFIQSITSELLGVQLAGTTNVQIWWCLTSPECTGFRFVGIGTGMGILIEK